ncbi:hypothetical protein V8D89_014057 [Ganoderma adspersum]
MMLVPSSVQTYSLMQTAVAILAIASLAVWRQGPHPPQEKRILPLADQEEMVLIAAFGLMWFAVLLGWRAFQQRGINPGFTPGKRPYPCRSDSVYCVVEEWTYW